MECIKTVSYLAKLNGQREGHIKPLRALWRGDPLSSYLFILLARGLSSIIHNVRKAHYIEGIRMTRHCPPLSHFFFFFEDDSFIFGWTPLDEAAMYDALINKYCS